MWSYWKVCDIAWLAFRVLLLLTHTSTRFKRRQKKKNRRKVRQSQKFLSVVYFKLPIVSSSSSSSSSLLASYIHSRVCIQKKTQKEMLLFPFIGFVCFFLSFNTLHVHIFFRIFLLSEEMSKREIATEFVSFDAQQ